MGGMKKEKEHFCAHEIAETNRIGNINITDQTSVLYEALNQYTRTSESLDFL